MNATKLLSIATVAAFATFGAQAGINNSNAGDVYGLGFDANTQSTLSRDAVRSEGAAALPDQQNNTLVKVKPMSDVSRSAIRAEAVAAVQAGELATGNRS